MTVQFRQLSFLLLAFVTLGVQSCKDDDQVIDDQVITEQDYSFPFTAVNEKGIIKLNWETLDVPDFEHYTIVRSPDSLPDAPQPSDLNGWFNSHFHIPEQETTLFLDDEPPFHNDLYYKMYVQAVDTFLLSQTIKVPSPSKALPFCYNHAAIIPNTDYIIIASEDTEVIKYDHKTHEIITTTPLPLEAGYIRIGDAGNGLEVFVLSKYNNTLTILDINNLAIKAIKNFDQEIFDVAPSPNGLLFITIDEPGASLQVLNRNNLELISSQNEQTEYYDRRIIVSPIDDKTLLEISTNELTLYTFFDTGQLIVSNSASYAEDTSIKRDISFSPDGNQFSPYYNGAIFNTLDLSLHSEFEINSGTHVFDNQNSEYIYFVEYRKVKRFDTATQDLKSIYSLDITSSQLLDIGDQLIFFNNGGISGNSNVSNCGFITTIDK